MKKKNLKIIEARNQCKLPAIYKDFLKNNDTSFIDLPENCYIGLQIPEFDYPLICENFFDLNFLKNYNRFSFQDNLLDKILIIHGVGNTGFSISVEQNKNYGNIHYFDFDILNNGILVSNDFNSFLENLRIFSSD